LCYARDGMKIPNFPAKVKHYFIPCCAQVKAVGVDPIPNWSF